MFVLLILFHCSVCPFLRDLCLDYFLFVESFEISPTWLLLFRIALANLDLLHFHIKVIIGLSTSSKTLSGILIGIV